jgi:hypothetical protein
VKKFLLLVTKLTRNGKFFAIFNVRLSIPKPKKHIQNFPLLMQSAKNYPQNIQMICSILESSIKIGAVEIANLM